MNDAGADAQILIIDDEPQIRRFLRISLKSQGYAVAEAASAAEGIRVAMAQTPDLIVLDLGLPDADGKTLLAELRAKSSVPVIVLSVRDSETEKVLTLDSGANDYVTKPFGIQEFLARVRNLLRAQPEPTATGETVFTDGHLTVDLGRRLVSRNGAPVHLTRKEFAVLGSADRSFRARRDAIAALASNLGANACRGYPLSAHRHRQAQAEAR